MNIVIAKAPNKIHLKYALALKKIGHKTVYFDIDTTNWQKNLKKIKKISAVVWHSNDKGKYYREILDKTRIIENTLNLPVFPDTNQYLTFNNKIKQYDIFKRLKIKQPKTFITYDKKESLNFLKKTKYPFVLKDAHSASALGVFLIKNKQEAKSIIEKIFSKSGHNSIYNHFYAQEFVANLNRSLRVITVGNEAICAYWRISNKNWKHNIAEGKVSQDNIPKSALKIAEKISKQLKYHWMSYDFIEKDKKLLCLENSCNFGVKGAVKLGYDIRLEQMKYMIKWLKKRKE